MMKYTQSQNDEKTRATKLKTYLIDEVLIYKNLIPFNNEAEDLGTNLTTLDTLFEGKVIETGGITEQKAADKLSIAMTGVILCGATKAYATKIGDKDLMAKMSYSMSDIEDMKDSEILGFVKKIVKIITPLLDDIVYKTYGITAIQLGAYSTLATHFNGQIGLVGTIVNSGTVANDNIDTTIKLIHGNIDMMELLLPTFQLLHPNFVAGFHLNAKTVDLGVHHGGFQGKITLETTGADLEGIKVEIIGTSKADTSDLLGDYSIIKVKPCTAIIQISGPKVVTQKITHTFHKGVIDTLDFKMESLKE